jgi:peptidylprolyl isomerase
MLSMATQKNSNGSQFFINTVKTQWLTGKHEIFGMVLEGLGTIVEIEKTGTFGGEPVAEIMIANSGSKKLELRDNELYQVSGKLEY